MNFKKAILVGVCLACCLFVSNAFAANTKIGVMDVQKIITGCQAGPGAQAKFDASVKEFETKFKKEEESLLALQKEIDKKRSVWKKAKVTEKMTEYQTKARSLQAKRANSQLIVRKMQDEAIKPILKVLEGVVEKYGKANKYAVILEVKGGVVYYDKATLVTDKLIKELDKAMK
ncbi:MAG: OmpH family outer membrane protein [Desulfotalea sp.]